MQKIHAKDCSTSIQQLLDAEARQLLHSNKSDWDPTSSSKATKIIRTDLNHLDGHILFPRQCIRLHLRHHGGNRATAGGQRGSGTLHHGEQCFLTFQMKHCAWRTLNLLAIDGRCDKYTNRAHVFLMRILYKLSRHALTSGTCVAQAQHVA